MILSSHLLEQVQEICDEVGIIFHGRLVREGKLNDLIAIEDQSEIVLQNATPQLLERIAAMVGEDDGAQLLSCGNPRTTLERLFLQEINEGSRQGGEDA